MNVLALYIVVSWCWSWVL